MTSRRGLLGVALLLAGCGKPGGRQNLLPETVGSQWRRASLGGITTSGLQPPLTASTVKRGQSAQYDGPGKVDVMLYELSSSAAALDAVQRWRAEANSIFFYRDEFFVVVHYDAAADRQALNAFVRDLSQHLAPSK